MLFFLSCSRGPACERVAVARFGYNRTGEYCVANAAMTDDTTSKTTCASDTVVGGNESRYAQSFCVAMLPFFVFGLTYAFYPSYVSSYLIPFLIDPGKRLILLGMIVWYGIGTWLLTRTSNFMLRVLIGALFMAPLLLVQTLGAAIIAELLGPIMTGK